MISALQVLLNNNKTKVLSWLADEHAKLEKQGLTLPVYSSFDIRDGGYKAAIVDSNLFPAGFNNLGDLAKENAGISLKALLPKIFSGDHVLIIPESHTRNLFYLNNLCAIKEILVKAGYKVTFGNLQENFEGESLEVKDTAGHPIILERLHRKNNHVSTQSFSDGLILLNNDFSVGNPPILDGVTQPIIPPLKLGWAHRKKSTHFKYFDCLLEEFAKVFSIDPFLLQTVHAEVNDVNFQNPSTLATVAKKVDHVINRIKDLHTKYNIDQEPYVFVKDNSGTYGMGIVSVSSGKEILNLNSQGRRKMLRGKQRSTISSVFIQEGIRTILTVDGHAAEPVMYSVGGKIIGGFMRVHPQKDNTLNLNSPGMKFDLLLQTDITKPLLNPLSEDNDLSLYGVLGDIANIAIAYERETLHCIQINTQETA